MRKSTSSFSKTDASCLDINSCICIAASGVVDHHMDDVSDVQAGGLEHDQDHGHLAESIILHGRGGLVRVLQYASQSLEQVGQGLQLVHLVVRFKINLFVECLELSRLETDKGNC